MALTTTVARELASPARPLTVVPMLSAIDAPSIPLVATGATVGASGLTVTASVAVGVGGLPVTASVAVVVVLRLPSASRVVAATLRVKLASAAGVMARLARFQLCTSTGVGPGPAAEGGVPAPRRG